MSDITEYSSSTSANGAQNSGQRSEREHTGLRTLDSHFSVREVYRALHCPYGTGVLREKARLRSDASTERVRQSAANNGEGVTAAQDRSGETGASL